MTLATTIDAMVAAGCTPEQLAAVVRVHGAAEETKVANRRANNAAHKRAQRDRQDRELIEKDRLEQVEVLNAITMSGDVTRCQTDIVVITVTSTDDTPSPDKEKSPTPPKEINPIPISEVEARARAQAMAAARTAERKAAFARFWAVWPHKVAKSEAEKAFAKVWTEADAIIEGIARYIADKPSDRSWMHASTFLNQRRWEDRPAPVGMPPARAGPLNGHAIVKQSTARALMEMARNDESNPSPGSLFGGESDAASAKPPIDGEFVEIA